MRADLKIYRDAVVTLDATAVQSTRKDFDKAVTRAEAARRTFQQARAKLNRHAAYCCCE